MPRIKIPPLEKFKLLVTTLRNTDNKAIFIWADEDGAMERYFESTITCHNMKIIVITTSGDAYSLNRRREIKNETLANIISEPLLNSSHKN